MTFQRKLFLFGFVSFQLVLFQNCGQPFNAAVGSTDSSHNLQSTDEDQLAGPDEPDQPDEPALPDQPDQPDQPNQPNPPPDPATCTFASDWQSPNMANSVGTSGRDYFRLNISASAGWQLVRALIGDRASSNLYMNGPDRLSIGMGPGSSPALKVLAPQGEVQNWNFYNQVYANNAGKTHVRASMEMYLPTDMEWGADQKLALGIWGGQPYKSTGGTSIADQLGWTVRMLNGSGKGIKAYAYALNRTGDFGWTSPAAANNGGHIPKGKWVKFQMEVKLNDIGESNGTVKIYMDNVYKVGLTGVEFRNSDRNWKIHGLIVNDMWGGTEEDPIRHSPKDQVYWYRNYKMESCR